MEDCEGKFRCHRCRQLYSSLSKHECDDLAVMRLNRELHEARTHVRELSSTIEALRERVGTLFDVIAHGDENHRAWLAGKIAEHFSTPSPAPEGGE